MKLSSSLVLIASTYAACPSTQCWDDDGNGGCTLNSNTCGITVTCSTGGMTLSWPDELFDSDSSSVYTYTESDTCAISNNQWTSPLGECGMSAAKEDITDNAGNTSKMLVFSKTISLGDPSTTANAFTSAGSAITIFTSDGSSTSVTFKCMFPVTAQATSDAVSIEQTPDITADAVGLGNWDNAFELGFFTDNTYGTAIAAGGTAGNLGDNLFAQATYTATLPAGVLSWYVSGCDVRLSSNAAQSLPIIKDSCFSGIVGAGYNGPNTGNADADKKVATNYQFQYNSFAFSTDASELQILVCDIQFCLVTGDTSTECDLQNLACPTGANNAAFAYTTYG